MNSDLLELLDLWSDGTFNVVHDHCAGSNGNPFAAPDVKGCTCGLREFFNKIELLNAFRP